jgi:hypothetical protein
MNILANLRKYFHKGKPNPKPANRGNAANRRGQQTNPSNGNFIPDPEWEVFLKY